VKAHKPVVEGETEFFFYFFSIKKENEHIHTEYHIYLGVKLLMDFVYFISYYYGQDKKNLLTCFNKLKYDEYDLFDKRLIDNFYEYIIIS